MWWVVRSTLCETEYGKDNQITHPTYESILLHALQMAELGNDIIRDFKLKLLLDNE